MRGIRNIEAEKIIHLIDLVNIKPGIISSMTLLDNSLCHVKLFAATKGESIGNEIYKGDMVYFLLEGEMLVDIGGKENRLKPGDVLRVRANIEHMIKAVTSFKMVQTLIVEE